MHSRLGHRVSILALVAAVTLAVGGCGDGSDGEDAAATTDTVATATEAVETETVPPETTETDTGETGTTTEDEATTTVRIVVENGAPVGGIERVAVARGTDVTLVVTSDVDEEIHVHGYDLSRDVSAGETEDLEFTADTAGRFEIELEHSGVQIAELTVEP